MPRTGRPKKELIERSDQALDLDTIKDKSNPNSLINMVNSNLATAINLIPERTFELTDEQLIKRADDDHAVVLHRLRHTFNAERERAGRTNTKIISTNIWQGVCDMRFFVTVVANNASYVAYIIRTPVDYKVAMEELLAFSTEQQRQIMAASHLDKDGRLDPKAAAVKQKIAEDIQNRVKGMPIHRTENLNKNVNENTNINLNRYEEMTPQEVERRIAEIENDQSVEIDSNKVQKISGDETKKLDNNQIRELDSGNKEDI